MHRFLSFEPMVMSRLCGGRDAVLSQIYPLFLTPVPGSADLQSHGARQSVYRRCIATGHTTQRWLESIDVHVWCRRRLH